MPRQKRVTLHYYAAFREAVGRGAEEVQTAAVTVAELYDEVRARHGFRFDRSVLAVALNDAVVPWTASVSEGDRVVFLAPFAGG